VDLPHAPATACACAVRAHTYLIDMLIPARRLATIQGAYYLLTGLWPLAHLRSFQAVTGPKLEPWLVKTVGVLAAAIGFTLVRSGR
jgi:hypothetical protein